MPCKTHCSTQTSDLGYNDLSYFNGGTRSADLIATEEEGYVAAMTRTGVMHLAGVFNGDLDKQPVDPTHVSGKEPQRADLPSFWDGFVIESYGGDFASALDVGVSAVYSVGALPGGGSLEARRYAHRSMP